MEAVAVGVAYTMSVNHPVPNVMIAANSGIEITQKHNLVLTWDRTKTCAEGIMEAIFGAFIRRQGWSIGTQNSHITVLCKWDTKSDKPFRNCYRGFRKLV